MHTASRSVRACQKVRTEILATSGVCVERVAVAGSTVRAYETRQQKIIKVSQPICI